MKFTIYFSIILLSMGNLLAQSTISGKISDINQEPIPYANIIVLSANDSSMIKGGVSGLNGDYKIEKIPFGKYQIEVSMMGYQTINQKITIGKEQHSQWNFSMEDLSNALEEVVIQATRPLIEIQPDKMIFNVENSVLATGGTAMEVLERVPGVSIDQDDNISLKGKQGVLVMIDGKRTFLSANELGAMLRGMAADGIASIEVIDNPSAKYDAEGNAGMLNIKMKKNAIDGLNGTLQAGVGYGRFGKSNAGGNINYQRKKLSLHNSFHYNQNNNYREQNILRKVTTANETQSFFSPSLQEVGTRSITFKSAINFELNNQHSVGMFINGNGANQDNDMTNFMRISNANNEVIESIDFSNQLLMNWLSLTYNLNYQYKISDRAKLSLDADYSKYSQSHQDNINSDYFTGLGGEVAMNERIRSKVPTVINIRSFQGDYEISFSEKSRMETGLKVSRVSTDNDILYEISTNDLLFEKDPLRSNQFIYDEDIYAAYSNYYTTIGKTKLQLGLRLEHTETLGNSVTLNEEFSRSYTELFPSLSANRSFGEHHTFGFAYSRRLDRPNYRSLNPFLFYLDPFTFYKGNPELQPQFTNRVGFNHSWKNLIMTDLSYSHTVNAFREIVVQEPNSPIAFSTPGNFDQFNNISASITVPMSITQWWMSNNNVVGFFNEFNSVIMEEQFTNQQFAYSLNSQNIINLSPNTKLEISAFYQSRQIDAIFEVSNIYGINFGIQHGFFNNKIQAKVNYSDILNSMNITATAQHADLDIVAFNNWESRIVRFTLSYRFSKGKDVKSLNRSGSASSEEMQRISQ
ncbi:MAG: TonB-dependent receptor family protein [Cyclobacteriaceae bacterium]|nr:outer membrane beta-barrel protein [Cyclobacteriaceae bacterium]MCH8514924.1 TonB-dependent receptor family protein [Cyclobacteriaceae bacterium]